MSKLISELLGAKEPIFSFDINKLEQASGRPGIDVRLTAEIIGQVHQKTASLALDPKDTTGPELYSALLHKISQDDNYLRNLIDCNENSDNLIPKIIDLTNNHMVYKSGWFIKKNIAKSMIKKSPPKNLMTLLDIKSVDTLVKNFSIWEIYLTINMVENTKWVRDFMANYKDLKPSDFEYRQIDIFQISEQFTDIIKQSNKYKPAMLHLKEYGAIGILPVPDYSRRGLAIAYLLHTLHFINHIRQFSAYIKVNQVRPDFTNILIDALQDNIQNELSVAGSDIHWKIVHRLYGTNNKQGLPSEFEPHLQADDISWRKTEYVLYQIDPGLGWWRDLDYVAIYHDGAPVVFNMIDMAINLLNNLSYSSRTFSHFRESLHNELYARYLGEKPLEMQILGQIDGNLTKHFQKKSKSRSKKVSTK